MALAVKKAGRNYDLAVSTLMAAVIVFQGGYFPYQYLIFSLFLCVILFVRMKFDKTQPPLSKSMVVLFFIFFLYLVSTIFNASNKYVGALEIFKMLGFMLFFYAVGLVEEKRVLLKGILNGCLIVALTGLFSYMDMFSFPNAILNDGNSLRLQSLIQYANVTALLMGIGYLISTYFIAGKSKIIDKTKYFLYANLFLTAMILTLSRATLLIFALIMVLWLLLVRELKITLQIFLNGTIAVFAAAWMYKFAVKGNEVLVMLVPIVSLLIAALLFYVSEKNYNKYNKSVKLSIPILLVIPVAFIMMSKNGISRITNLSLRDGTLVERWIYVSDAFSAILEKPFLGIGPGGWESQQYHYQTAQYYAKYVHNGLMQVALDAGAFAMGLFLFVFIWFYLGQIRKYCAKRDPVVILSIVAVTFILLHSLLDVDLSFMSVLAILVVFMQITGGNEKSRFFRWVPSIKRRALGRFILSCSVVAIAFILGQVLYHQGQKAYEGGNDTEAMRIFKASNLFRPFDPEVKLALAKCYEKSGAEKEEVEKLLTQACLLDKYEPSYLKEKISFMEKAGDFESVYEDSLRLISVEPMNSDNYESALKGLEGLYKEQKITFAYYREKGYEILDKIEQANQRFNSNSRYLRNQEPISLDKKLTEKFME